MKNVIGSLVVLAALLATQPVHATQPELQQVQLREQNSSGSVALSTAGSDCSTSTTCATLKTNGAATCAFNLVFVGTATAQFEGSINDGTTYVSIKAVPLAGGAEVTSATASGQWRSRSSGLRRCRVRLSAHTDDVTAWINASSGETGSTAVPSGGALDATVSVMSAKLPAALGSTTSANSISTTPASDAVYSAKSQIAERSDELHCYVATTATGSTQITGCEVQSGKNIYITSACISGDILSATANPFTLQSGTSTACSGPHVIWSGWHPALTNYCVTFPTPLKVTVSEGLCILDAVTGSKSAMVSGFVK